MGFRRLIQPLIAVGLTASLALPCGAQPSPTTVPTTTIQNDFEVTGNSFVDGNFRVAGTTTHVGNVVNSGNMTVTGTITSTGAMKAPSQILTGTNFNATLIALAALGQATTFTFPDPGTASDTVATLAAANTFSGTNIFSTPLATASVNHAIKSKIFTAKVSPAAGAVAVNGTTYFVFLYPGRAWTVKQIGYATHVDPVSGTNTIKVLKAAANGNTMLNAASVSLNATTIDTDTIATLTATGADLSGTATQPIYCEYTAGTQGAAAKDVTVEVELELTDY